MSVLANTSEHIEHFAAVGLGILHAIRRDDRQSIRPRKIDKLPVDLLFTANKTPLNLDENIFPPKGVDASPSAIREILGNARALACTVRRLAERREISGGGAGNNMRGACAPRSEQRHQPFRKLR